MCFTIVANSVGAGNDWSLHTLDDIGMEVVRMAWLIFRFNLTN